MVSFDASQVLFACITACSHLMIPASFWLACQFASQNLDRKLEMQECTRLYTRLSQRWSPGRDRLYKCDDSAFRSNSTKQFKNAEIVFGWSWNHWCTDHWHSWYWLVSAYANWTAISASFPSEGTRLANFLGHHDWRVLRDCEAHKKSPLTDTASPRKWSRR